MPSCFKLVKKGETNPTLLNVVDEEICEHLGIPTDEVHHVIEFKIGYGS